MKSTFMVGWGGSRNSHSWWGGVGHEIHIIVERGAHEIHTHGGVGHGGRNIGGLPFGRHVAQRLFHFMPLPYTLHVH